MKLTKIIFIYFCVLSIAAFFNEHFAAEAAQLLNFFIGTSNDLRSHPFIRYRAVIWLAAVTVFLILLPIVFIRGLTGINKTFIKNTHWFKFLLMSILISATIPGFLLISMCSTCWTGNDAFLFLLAVFAFSGFQVVTQAVFLKLFDK